MTTRRKVTRPRQAMSPSAVDRLERTILRLDRQLEGVLASARRAQTIVRYQMLNAVRRAERR